RKRRRGAGPKPCRDPRDFGRAEKRVELTAAFLRQSHDRRDVANPAVPLNGRVFLARRALTPTIPPSRLLLLRCKGDISDGGRDTFSPPFKLLYRDTSP